MVTIGGFDGPDDPHFMVLPSIDMITTRRLTYLRAHGRNAQGYIRERTVAGRFDYDYPKPELEEIEDELEERFGKLPVQSENLIATARLELDCCRLGILQIDAGPDAVAAVLRERPLLSKPKMKKTRYPLLWKEGRVIYRRPSAPAERLAAVRELVDVLECCSG